MHEGWDDELARLAHARAAFGPDGALTEAARVLAAGRHPVTPSVRRHLLVAISWSLWSLGWCDAVDWWDPDHRRTPAFLLAALLLWLAGLGTVGGFLVSSWRRARWARQRYVADLRRLVLTPPSASGGSAPGAPGRPG